MPQRCPVCDSAVERDRERSGLPLHRRASSVRRSASRRSCISRRAARWTSKAWARSWSISSSTAGMVRHAGGSLRARRCPRWRSSSAWRRNRRRTCVAAIERSKQPTLARFIYALGITQRRRGDGARPGAAFRQRSRHRSMAADVRRRCSSVAGHRAGASRRALLDVSSREPHNREGGRELCWPPAIGGR